MNTNYLMLKELLNEYHPIDRGFVSAYERKQITDILCLDEMNILQLRNLRDFTVSHLGHSEKMEDWDRMSAIIYVIDLRIFELGGEV